MRLLHKAIEQQNIEAVKFLVNDELIDLHAKNENGKNAVELAYETGNSEIIDILEGRRKNTEHIESCGLENAPKNGTITSTGVTLKRKVIIESGANVNSGETIGKNVVAGGNVKVNIKIRKPFHIDSYRETRRKISIGKSDDVLEKIHGKRSEKNMGLLNEENDSFMLPDNGNKVMDKISFKRYQMNEIFNRYLTHNKTIDSNGSNHNNIRIISNDTDVEMNSTQIAGKNIVAGGNVSCRILYQPNLVGGKNDIVDKIISSQVDDEPLEIDDTITMNNEIDADFLDVFETRSNVDVKDEQGNTPLLLAAQHCNLDAMKFLINSGGNIFTKSKFGSTILHHAASGGNIECIKLLIESGLDVNEENDNSVTPLLNAAEHGQLNAMKYLIEANANVYHTNNLGYSVLHVAALSGKLDCVQYLVENFKFDVNAPNNNGLVPLLIAAHRRHFNIVKYLITNGSNILSVDENGSTVLHIAAEKEDKECIDFLLNAGIDINIEDNCGETPIFYATREGPHDIILHLFAKNASIFHKKKDGKTLLHSAAFAGMEDTVTFLLDHGFDINVKDVNNRTPLLDALANRRLKTAQLFVFEGADIRVKDIQGWSVLFCAVTSSRLDCVEYVLEMGCDVNERDVKGYTPILLAASEGNLSIVKFLLASGADVFAKENTGKNGLHLAAMSGNVDCIKFFKDFKQSSQ